MNFLILQFNIHSLGRFLKTFTLQAKEVATDLTFPTKLFIFDRFLLYTKMISNISLAYRNHFSFTTGFSFMLQESRYAFRVSDGNRSNDVLFFSFENVDAVSDVKKLIGQYYDPRRSNDSAFSSMPAPEECETTSDDDSEWEIEDETLGKKFLKFSNFFTFSRFLIDETIHVANSCFYLQSPKLESN